MSLITIPREVGKAITELKIKLGNEFLLDLRKVENASIAGNPAAQVLMKSIGQEIKIKDYYTVVMGGKYRIEETPHEKLRQIYKEGKKLFPANEEDLYYNGRGDGIWLALTTLGIEVEGITKI